MADDAAQNDTLSESTRSLVPAIYFDIFLLRVMGLNMNQIAERTHLSYDRIRHLFAAGGAVHELWLEWKAKHAQESFEDTMMIMTSHLPDIARAKVLQAKQEKGEGSVAAARMVFEYTMGRPVEKIKMKIEDNRTTADLVREVMITRQQNERQRQSTISNRVAGESA